jgi:type IV secretion system pilin
MLPAAMHMVVMADSSSAASVMRSFVSPVVGTMCVLASLVCAFFLVNGGFQYMTSAGKVDNLDHAKRVIRNALIGLIIVLAAAVLTTILTHAYSGSPYWS